ncbi:MAG: hypothetical protein GWN86_19835 [Desulfobacterales bacterium]|nr:hypothetical protein [Desulfobacterales bacterium]
MKDLICFILGHKYRLAQKLTPQNRRVGCIRCHKSFAMSDDVQTVVTWDADFHRMYERHGITIEYQRWEYDQHTKQAKR